MSGRRRSEFDPDRDESWQASDLIGLLRQRAPKTAFTIAAGQAAWPGIKYVQSKIESKRLYTVKVPGGPGNDGLYDELHSWVLSLLPSTQQKALVAYVARKKASSGGIAYADDSIGFRRRVTSSGPSHLGLRYDGSRKQKISVDGFSAEVTVSDGGPSGISGSEKFTPPQIVFSTTTIAARDAVIAAISGILESNDKMSHDPVFRMLNQWDEWERVDDLPPRTLESIILPKGQLEAIQLDLERFIACESDYSRRSIPWHRGHLYEGPPGTGKTSVARALACHSGLDMWYLSLAGIKSDTNLIKTIMNIKSKSVLLLEDIDVFHVATSRGDSFGGTTLSGLLNALDGIATPHGLITIMTANRPQALDSALIRPGRIDLVEHFGLSGPDELTRLVRYWFELPENRKLQSLPKGLRISAADATEVCKRSNDPGGAMVALSQWKEEKNEKEKELDDAGV